MSTSASWEHDFEWLDEIYATAPYEMWDELRGECPIAFSDRHGGAWMPTSQEMIAAVAYDTALFSSRNTTVSPIAEGREPVVAPPITSDPPLHAAARRVLLPFFSPRAVADLEPLTRSISSELIADLAGRERADAAAQYAKHIPVRVITRMLGLPESDEDQFTIWVTHLLQDGMNDPELAADAARAVFRYFHGVVEERREVPGDDLVSELLVAEMNGAPLTQKHIVGTCFLLLLAGMDTTWSSIGASLWHLGTVTADRDRILADPSLLDTAIEEFLRAYAPVTMARVVTEDSDSLGCPMHRGDKVLLPFGAGNRDPGLWDRPDEVLIDRAENRHHAFGIGIHRCLGSNLARMELRVALSEWLAAFPHFEVDPDEPVTWVGSQVRGPREIPVLLRGEEDGR